MTTEGFMKKAVTTIKYGNKYYFYLIILMACNFLMGSCSTTRLKVFKEGTQIISEKEYFYRYNWHFRKPITFLSMPATVSSIGASAFENNAISTLNIPPLVSRIEERSFRSNRIEKLFIPSTVKRIGAEAFRANNISELIISEGVEIIDDYAFVFNPLLKIVHIPDSITSLALFAFDPEVILTGNEHFKRTSENSYCRITTNFNNAYRYIKNPNSLRINGKYEISDVAYFMPDTEKDAILVFDIHNTRTEWTNLVIKYRFVPGHDYELIFEEYELFFSGIRGEMLEFIVIDKETGIGKYWQYGWRDGHEEALEKVVDYQQLMGIYRTGSGFDSGKCKRDAQGNIVTLADKEFKGKVPRFLLTSSRIRIETKESTERIPRPRSLLRITPTRLLGSAL
jgi:hypothetical protein